MDDIVVFSRSPDDHIEHVSRIVRLLYESEVMVKQRRCYFFAETIISLCLHITPGCVEPAEHMTDEVAILEHLTTRTVLCSFLSLCNVFGWFVPYAACLAAPANKKLRKNRLKRYGLVDEKKSAAFGLFKKALISPSALALLGTEEQYTLDTDACEKRIEFVLFQEHKEGSKRLVGY